MLRTKPTFSLINKIPLTIFRRKQGYWDKGRWVEGKATEVELEAHVQPLRYTQFQHLPEADRTKQWLTLFSSEPISMAKEGEGGWDSDEFYYEGDRYRVIRVRHYQMGVLDHWEAEAVRWELSGGEAYEDE